MLVSCIMATHDRRRFVADAVACFQAQTLVDSELIVVDDGADSVMDLVPTGDRFRYVQLEGRHHFCALRDVGLKFARGKYVAVWDDDDLPAPERLAVQVGALEVSGAALCLLGSSIVTREDPPGRWIYTPPQPWPLDNSAVLRRLPGFRFHLDATPYSALRALKAAFADSLTVVHDRPGLLTTRRHADNTCARPLGQGPEWIAQPIC